MKNIHRLASLFYKLAIPLESDLIENLFSEPLRKTIPSDRNILVYHGTSTEKLKKIISHGSLNPTESIKAKSFENTSPGIYVTTKLTGFSSSAEFYAHKAKEVHGGDPIAIELSLPIGWIEIDPDDSRVLEETGVMNEAGQVQGRVTQSIPINKITQIIEFPGGFSHPIIYPFGVYIEKILKQKGHKRDYRKDLKEQLSTAPFKEPIEDEESKLAKIFNNWYDNIYTPKDIGINGLSVYDNILIIVFEFKNKNALEAINKLCQIMAEDVSMIDPDNYPEQYIPKKYETLRMFLKRYNKS